MKDPVHGKRIIEIFTKDMAEEKDVAEALDLIKRTDAIEYCRKRAEAIVEEAVSNLETIPESQYKDSMIALAKYIVDRDR